MEISYYTGLEVSTFSLKEIREIFFEASSIKKFKDRKAKDLFFHRWCGQYLERYPAHFFVATENNKVLGYSCSHPDSLKAIEEFQIPGQEVFSKLYQEFPLHLHINCHTDSRGKGVGRGLIERQCELSSKGMNIITTPSSQNYGFYKVLGFDKEVKGNYNGDDLLFMGKKTGQALLD